MCCGDFQIQHTLVPHPEGKRLTCLDYPYLYLGRSTGYQGQDTAWCLIQSILTIFRHKILALRTLQTWECSLVVLGCGLHDMLATRERAGKTLKCRCVGYLAEYLVFHVTCILLHDLPVIDADGLNTYTNGLRDVRNSTGSDGDALCNVQTASQGSWNLKVGPF